MTPRKFGEFGKYSWIRQLSDAEVDLLSFLMVDYLTEESVAMRILPILNFLTNMYYSGELSTFAS